MAVWQFDVQLIPQGAPVPEIAEDGIDVAPCWDGFSTTVNVQKRLEQRFGLAREVLPGWLQWGDEKSNRIDADLKGGRLTGLSARLDARSQFEPFLQFLCELANDINCRFFSAEFKSMIDANPATLRGELLQSRAALWCTDPIAVLEHAKKEHDDAS
jgi:hypothetical protein